MIQTNIDVKKFKSLDPRQINIRLNEPMAGHCTFKIGGTAAVFVEPATKQALFDLLTICRADNLPIFILGRGSNTLFADGFIDRIIISTNLLDNISAANATTLLADAGAKLRDIAFFAMQQGLTGFEFACGIPGTLGGALYMNAGAHGGEMGHIVQSATVVDRDGAVSTLTNAELGFAYRRSFVMDGGLFVLDATVKLSTGDKDEINAKMQGHLQLRNDKQPINMPSAGSAFKRPGDNIFAAKLIDDCGLKGYAVGGAQVSEKHSGFIVNTGDATAEDVLTLIKYIQDVVRQKDGITLHPEIIYVD